MRHVARTVGVATSTVSKALRNDPSIPEARCKEIRATAEHLGYRPDPLVATLMAQLHHRRRRTDPHKIAWIDLWGSERSSAVMSPEPMIRGARDRANELGYGLEIYQAAKDQISPERLRQILTNRGQWGLIFPAVPESAMRFPFDMRGFAGVTIGTSLHQPVMHRVAPNHFQGCVLAFDRLREHGYHRIGLAISPEVNERVEGKWLGAFLFCQQRLPLNERVPPLIAAHGNREAFLRWFQRKKPDALILAERPPVQTIDGKRPMICWLNRSQTGRGERGLDFHPDQLGSVAVEWVVAQIHRNERGSPAFPNTVLIDADWIEEESVESQL